MVILYKSSISPFKTVIAGPEELLEIAAAVCIFEKEENGKDSNTEKSDIKTKK